MIDDKWERAYLDLERAVPFMGACLATVSLGVGFMSLSRPVGQRIHYQDGQYLVSVRSPGQWHDLREFIQPNNPDVMAIYSQVGPDIWGCIDWVCRNISYRQDIGEWWSFPTETIKRDSGDCEDSAILSCSLIRNFTNAYVALGSYQGFGHAWCQVGGGTYETTYTLARPVADPENYCPHCLFNEHEVIELWPGALAEVFDLQRDEATKLNLMMSKVSQLALVSNPDISWVPALVGSGIIAAAILLAAILRR